MLSLSLSLHSTLPSFSLLFFFSCLCFCMWFSYASSFMLWLSLPLPLFSQSLCGSISSWWIFPSYSFLHAWHVILCATDQDFKGHSVFNSAACCFFSTLRLPLYAQDANWSYLLSLDLFWYMLAPAHYIHQEHLESDSAAYAAVAATTKRILTALPRDELAMVWRDLGYLFSVFLNLILL